MKRTKQTAEVVALNLKANIVLNDLLIEVGYGEASGKQKQELGSLFGDGISEKWSSDEIIYDNIKFPNGESKIEVRERILNL